MRGFICFCISGRTGMNQNIRFKPSRLKIKFWKHLFSEHHIRIFLLLIFAKRFFPNSEIARDIATKRFFNKYDFYFSTLRHKTYIITRTIRKIIFFYYTLNGCTSEICWNKKTIYYWSFVVIVGILNVWISWHPAAIRILALCIQPKKTYPWWYYDCLNSMLKINVSIKGKVSFYCARKRYKGRHFENIFNMCILVSPIFLDETI